MDAPAASSTNRRDVDAVQRRTVLTMTIAQIFSGLGNGSTLALGSILAVELSGNVALAGTTTTALHLATALLALPLAGIAVRHGRRKALTLGLAGATAGTILIVLAITWRSFPLLALGSFLVGLGGAVNLQARFAATDLARPERRGRDLSLVVWAITIGAVAGPNTVVPGAALSAVVGLPAEAGPFLISSCGMLLGALLLWIGLRPDPLLLAQELASPSSTTPSSRSSGTQSRPVSSSAQQGLAAIFGSARARGALAVLLSANAVMVAVMSMTPLHLQHTSGHMAHDPGFLSLVGLTFSLHVAGMYALSPLMGWSTDRFGGGRTALTGMILLLVAVAVAGLGQGSTQAVTIGLILLGLGWSAATCAGSAVLVDAISPHRRVSVQGLGDALLSGAGAIGSVGAGLVMGWTGFGILNTIAAALLITAVAYAWLQFTKSPTPRAESMPSST